MLLKRVEDGPWRLRSKNDNTRLFKGCFWATITTYMKQIILLVFLLLSPVTYADTDEWNSFYDGTKTIHLKFTDIINDKYNVNIVWMPRDGEGPRLVGPAIITFSKDSGYVFSVTADNFHLPFDELKESGILKFDNDGQAVKVDLSKVYSFEYSSDSFNKVSLMNNTHKYEASGSREQVPFFFEDVDFDGKDELVMVSFNSGQRWYNEYIVYKSNYKYGNMYNLVNTEPLSIIDQLSTFNKQNRTIDVFSSGGACTNSNEKFKLIDGKYIAIELTEWDYYVRDGVSVCEESIYTVIDDKRILKSKSESYWDYEQAKHIELDTKYY